eukprot:267969-Pleurochrysis_carterae.AAC.1
MSCKPHYCSCLHAHFCHLRATCDLVEAYAHHHGKRKYASEIVGTACIFHTLLIAQHKREMSFFMRIANLRCHHRNVQVACTT